MIYIMTEITTILQSAGLSDNEAVVYQTLLEYGELKASDVIRRTGLKRGNTYNVLYSLVQKNIVREGEKNGVATYQPLNPANLRSLIERDERELHRREKQLESALPTLLSEFNKGHHRPSVQIYEGSTGVIKALNNTLKATETIYTYVDFQTVQEFMVEESEKYVAERNKTGVKKHVLLIDNQTGRDTIKNANKDYTEYRIISASEQPIEAYLEIYNNTLTYLTISKSNKLAVEIHDERLYQLHRYLFEQQWEMAEVV